LHFVSHGTIHLKGDVLDFVSHSLISSIFPLWELANAGETIVKMAQTCLASLPETLLIINQLIILQNDSQRFVVSILLRTNQL
jgi:hypothetical protein